MRYILYSLLFFSLHANAAEFTGCVNSALIIKHHFHATLNLLNHHVRADEVNQWFDEIEPYRHDAALALVSSVHHKTAYLEQVFASVNLYFQHSEQKFNQLVSSTPKKADLMAEYKDTVGKYEQDYQAEIEQCAGF